MGDLSIGNYDLAYDSRHPGELYAPWAMGLNFGAQYNFRPNLYTCIVLAEARYFPRYGAAGDEYKYGLYGAWNLFWEPTSRIQCGVEYLAGRRNNIDHTRHGQPRRRAFPILFLTADLGSHGPEGNGPG